MKFLLALFLAFSVLADFTAASVGDLEEDSICESITDCNDVDLHNESDKDHKSENHKHHCHCHTGHSHIAVCYILNGAFGAIHHKISFKHPLFKLGKLQNYHSEIIRPPIA